MPSGVRLCGDGEIYLDAGVPSSAPGAAQTGAVLTTNGADKTVLSLANNNVIVERLQIVGGGPQSTTSAVVLTSPDVRFIACNITGGVYAINAAAGGFRLEDSFVGQSYGQSSIYINNGGGGVLIDSYVNQPWNNIGAPAFGTTVGTRTRGLGVTAGQLYQYTDSFSKVWLLHVLTSGTTSAFSDPVVLPYGQIIQDGSAQFYLRAPFSYYGVQMDTGTSGVTAYGTDFSGAHSAAIAMTNSLAGVIPTNLSLTNCTSSNSMGNAVLLNSGYEVSILGCRFNQTTVTGTAVIQAGLSFGGDLIVSNSTFKAATQGVSILGGVYSRVTNCRFGNLTTAVNIGANVTDFSVINNNLGSSTIGAVTNGIVVNTGTSDYYTIADNDTHGCTTPVTDNGSGTHKRVQGISQATPIRVNSIAASPVGNSTTTRNMQGVGFQFTPAATGNVLILVTTGLANGVDQVQASARMLYGTGTPPVNGVAETGTLLGQAMNVNSSGANGQGGGSQAVYLSGLTVGTTYWLDLSLKSSTGGDLAICINIQFTVIEV